VRAGRASRTAFDNALVRALDARHPPEARVADDRLAIHFLPLGYRILVELARVAILRRAIEGVIDARWPGPRRGVVARTRYIDDLVASALPSVGQSLLLGAGFDTRPYRLPAMAGVPVFEVDHPTTQAQKRRLLERALRDTPRNLTFVPVEFGADDPASALASSGFTPNMQTLVLWEGVSNYLDADAVDATFAFLRSATAVGSPLVFTYVDAAIIAGDHGYEGADESMRRVSRQGEPFTFGLEPEAAPDFLAARGFDVLDDLNVADLVVRYYGARAKGYAYYHVAHARRS
jgi:methyltransferase (TIGR00027 family)